MLGAGPAAADPDQTEVPHGGAARFELALELKDLVPALERREGVQAADHAGPDDDDPAHRGVHAARVRARRTACLGPGLIRAVCRRRPRALSRGRGTKAGGCPSRAGRQDATRPGGTPARPARAGTASSPRGSGRTPVPGRPPAELGNGWVTRAWAYRAAAASGCAAPCIGAA